MQRSVLPPRGTHSVVRDSKSVKRFPGSVSSWLRPRYLSRHDGNRDGAAMKNSERSRRCFGLALNLDYYPNNR